MTVETSIEQQAFPSARRLAERIRAREVSPTEVAEIYLERIAALNPTLNAFLTVDEEAVRADARAAEQALADGDATGPLHGVPVAVKDLEDTRGLRTTYGAGPYADNVPDADTVLVERLRAAGAIVLGKTNTPPFGLLGETKNNLGDHCRNPWDATRTTGGSSGGSAAAIATDLAPLATGTDSAGSITCPAGMCGVFGIKPSHGRVPMFPNYGDSLSFNDGGPLTRSVEDAALMLSVLAGHDPRDPVSLREPAPDFLAAVDAPLGAVRIAYSPDLGHFAVDREVRDVTAAATRAFGELGCEPEQATPQVQHPLDGYGTIYQSDAQASLADYYRDHADDLFPETVREIEGADRITGAEVAAAFGRLRRFQADMAEFFARYDLLLTPATAVPAFPVGEPPAVIDGVSVEAGWQTFMPFQIPWNVTGQPVANVPCGFSADGLPIGLLIVGPVGGEALVLSAAAAFERLRPWAGGLPPQVPRP
jgi:amidase